MAEPLTIHFKKGRQNKSDTLHCIPPDGSDTWSAIHKDMMSHELMHFVVESVLGFDHGFFGHLRHGYNISDFEQKDGFKPAALKGMNLHHQAQWSEHIVHMFVVEAFQGHILDNIVSQILRNIRSGGIIGVPSISDIQVIAIRNKYKELYESWLRLSPGSALVLHF